jgi:hypothetical protein
MSLRRCWKAPGIWATPSNWHGNVKRNSEGRPNEREAAAEAEEAGGHEGEVAASGGGVDPQTSGSKGDDAVCA